MAEEAAQETSGITMRAVDDAHGQTWYVYPVIAMTKVGAPRRTSWLCLESGDDRRFIAPVPAGWVTWNDAMLLQSIATAKPDLRS